MHETQTWVRSLDFYKQENAYLKTRLSQVVDNNSDKVFLVTAEHFHNRFIFIDEYIKELKQDARMQLEMIKQSLAGHHAQDLTMAGLHKKLRGEMSRFEKDIYNLKNEFNEKMVNYFDIS